MGGLVLALPFVMGLLVVAAALMLGRVTALWCGATTLRC